MQQYRIKPGSSIRLDEYDPNDTEFCPEGKEAARSRLATLNAELAKLQEVLYAQHRHKVLVVLQGMDTSGKDGTTRHVFAGVNPQGVRVTSFKKPTLAELDHDFLWRVHQHVPARGEIGIFNRSHYEDVLIVRVHDIVPKKIWSKRYEHIRSFERLLADEGTTILKFYLHVDRKEQTERLQARLDDSEKRWKFNVQDLEERKLWREYMEAYEEALSETSTEWAPWYVVPANRKWYRDLVVASILVEAMRELKMEYPRPEVDVANLRLSS